MGNIIKKLLRGTTNLSLIIMFTIFGSGAVIADDPGFDKLSEPLKGLTTQELADFEAGLGIFETCFTPTGFGVCLTATQPPGPPAGPVRAGGGPMQNTFGPLNSCSGCHRQVFSAETIDPTTGLPGTIVSNKDGGGHGGFFAIQITAHNESTGECDVMEGRGGPGYQINIGGLPAGTEALVNEDGLVLGGFGLAGGEYRPLVNKDGIAAGPRDIRTTNDLFGLGLLDAIPDWRLWKKADPYDSNGDGISGRAHWVVDHEGHYRVGKFGRKSEVAHLDEFNAEAFQNEMGVTNDEFPDEGVLVTGKTGLAPPNDLITVALSDPDGDPEVDLNHHDLDLANAYVRFLAPPRPNLTLMSKPDRRKGKRLFRKTGCASCHTPKLKTGWHKTKALRNKVIRPYSDLLLHDMGPDLAEGCKGKALPSEWRTEPLWGLRFVAAGYLHDGRAASLDEAIQLHGGEAAGSRDKYNALSQTKQALLIDFLNTL